MAANFHNLQDGSVSLTIEVQTVDSDVPSLPIPVGEPTAVVEQIEVPGARRKLANALVVVESSRWRPHQGVRLRDKLGSQWASGACGRNSVA